LNKVKKLIQVRKRQSRNQQCRRSWWCRGCSRVPEQILCGKIWANFGRNLANFGKIWTNFGKIW